MMLKIVVAILCLLLFVNGQDNDNKVELIPEQECPPCDCTSDNICIEVDIANPCSCCSKCNRGVGEQCGSEYGECSSDLLCLPDDPYSANYHGKCYEITPCLTFGCMVDNGECSCYYNNVCPIQRFPYYTKEECEDDLKKERCKEVTCPTALNDEECGEGMYYEEGPSFLDHCCPANGRCVCNVTQCTDDLTEEECPEGSQLMTEKANRQEGQCCDNHYCKEITCSHKGIQYTYGDTWKDGVCTNCSCTTDGLMCITMNCTSQSYDTCTETYTLEGQCCPVCIPPLTVSTVLCLTKEGIEYSVGESWDTRLCTTCQCKENGSIQCNDKVCDEIVCKEGDKEYYIPLGSCCPACKDTTLNNNSSDMTNNDTSLSNNMFPSNTDTPPSNTDTPPSNTDTPPSNTDTPPSNTDTPPSNTDTPPSNTETPPSNTDTPTSNNIPIETRNLVLLLNVPFNEVESHWSEFSNELMIQLKDKSINIQDISIRPDTSSNVNATIFTMVLEAPVNETSHETDIALVVNQMAMDYSMTMLPPLSTNGTPIAVSDNTQSQLTATIIVLTLLAAITLVSFIGVVIILVMINRRLKTAKTIRGIPTKPSRAP